MKRHAGIVLFVAALACAPAQAPDVSTPAKTGGESGRDTPGVVETLRAKKLRVESAGTIEQPFFSVPATVYRVEDGDLQIYRYASVAAAESDAKKVSPNGAIGGSMPMWIAPPHFFRRESLIVLYLGSNPQVLEVLKAQLGPQFAGQ